MLFISILIALNKVLCANAYTNTLYNINVHNGNISGESCGGFSNPQPVIKIKQYLQHFSHTVRPQKENSIIETDFSFSTVSNKVDNETDVESKIPEPHNGEIDVLAHYPSGHVLRGETFHNKSGVHLPMSEWVHRGHCHLNTTVMDFMQTAVNAFAIFLDGNLDDVLRMPAIYVLRSARTLAMMKIAREKLVATWTVVKGDYQPEEITYQTLEYYRPLFKYINGREMSRLNLDDDRILSFIGTHSDLDRHQVGVIASKYIGHNKRWRSSKYLNLMNNLLCGVPMKFMRKIPESVYLQLSHQLFYHIKACDPLQRRFYLAMMTRSQVLGKSNSWGARDVSRLGLLLAEVEGPELSAINPEAMAGITSQVMMEMSPHNLNHLTKAQLRYLGQKPLSILIKKINEYDEQQRILNSAGKTRLLSNVITSFSITLKIVDAVFK